jgi:hypothetical protein
VALTKDGLDGDPGRSAREGVRVKSVSEAKVGVVDNLNKPKTEQEP